MLLKINIASLIILLFISGCTTGSKVPEFSYYSYMGSCGRDENQRQWKYVDSIPEESSQLLILANENPVLSNANLYAVESWFENDDSELMVCRTSQAPKDSCIGSWWIFRQVSGEWDIIKKEGWVCVT